MPHDPAPDLIRGLVLHRVARVWGEVPGQARDGVSGKAPVFAGAFRYSAIS